MGCFRGVYARAAGSARGVGFPRPHGAGYGGTGLWNLVRELWLGSVNAVAEFCLVLRGVHRVLASRMVDFSFGVEGGGPLLRRGTG